MFDLIELAWAVSPYTIVGEGNVSKRTPQGIQIKASGIDLKTMGEKDTVLCDLEGTQLDSFDMKPSMEVNFHAWFMKTFPEVNFIAHTHPVQTNKILCSSSLTEFATTRLFPDQVVRNGAKSCVVPYATPGPKLQEAIKKSVETFMDKETYFPKLILLQNHGIIVASTSVKDCIASTMMCEKSAEIYIGAKSLGVKQLHKEYVIEIDLDPKEKYRREILNESNLRRY